tara:strand:- start:373 stop:1101 length:729 start_codon:yes stop_codon:yes gene_type:complete
MIQDLPKGLLEASRTVLQDSKDYEEFFKKALKKFGVDSPADFKSDEEKKKFFDYVDKNYKGKSESVKKFSRSFRLDEASLNYVYFDKAEANRFLAKVKNFVDSAEMEKSIAGHFNVILKGDKKALKKATDIAIKMSESVEPLDEAKKGKYKSKKQSQIIKEFEKIKKREKKEGYDVKDIDAVIKMFKKGIETEMYDDMEILTGKSLKLLDKHFMNMDTMVREELAAVIMKADIDLYDMMFGY